MPKLRALVVAVILTALVAALAAAYLTGFIIIGDPFSGVWNTDPEATLGPAGTWRTTGPNLSSGVLIKQTSSGYVYVLVVGGKGFASHPLERRGRVLESWARGMAFEYQPWSGHLVLKDQGHNNPPDNTRRPPMTLVLKKVTDSTSIPPQTR